MDIVEQLEKLKVLKEKGVLSEDEYKCQEQMLLEQLTIYNTKNIGIKQGSNNIHEIVDNILVCAFIGVCLYIGCMDLPREEKNKKYSDSFPTRYVSITDEVQERYDRLQEKVEIIEQYDCVKGKIKYHQVCGILENKSYGKRGVTVYADYYDKNNVKLESNIDVVEIDSYGKSKFSTLSYLRDEPFDHYKLRLQVDR